LIEISTDGVVYTLAVPTSGYTKHFRNLTSGGNPYSGPMPGRDCFGGTIGWSDVDLDLSAYAWQTVYIRFRFASDAATTNEGWYVDDIVIRGEPFGPPDPVDDLIAKVSGMILNFTGLLRLAVRRLMTFTAIQFPISK